MKEYVAILLVLLLPFALASCGGSSDGEDPGAGQKDTPPSSTPEARSRIYTFSDDSSLTPNIAFATDEEMVIVLGSELDGEEMPFKSVILKKDGIGSMLVEISASGLPSAIITGDSIFKINKYSYVEGKWFMQFSADQDGTISNLTVELPQSFGEHISNLDSWMRNRINTADQASLSHDQSQSSARDISTDEFLEFVALTVEFGACGISTATANPLVIVWACQSAARSTIDFLDDAPLVSPTNLDTQKCFFGIGENGISFLDPACLIATGLRIAADRVRDDSSDISEMEELADKSMDGNRFIGEDPIIEDFPTPLLMPPQVAIISPQWRETFTSEQNVRIQVAASEGVEVIDYEIRSKESGAFLISGNTGKGLSGNFEIDIASENFEPGTYFVTVSATTGEFSSRTYSSFEIEQSGLGYWKGTFRITEELYVSGNDVGAAKRACQSVFSGIRYTAFVPPTYEITLPSIEGPEQSVMRVDGDWPSGGWYCTQNEVSLDSTGFDYIARVRAMNNVAPPVPLHESNFSFIYQERSNSNITGTFSALAKVYRNDPMQGEGEPWQHWHEGSCKGEFELTWVEDHAFQACPYTTAPNTMKICRSTEWDPKSPYYCEWTYNP